MSTSGPRPQGLEILDKVDGVLRCLAAHGEARADLIADETEEPISSTYRLLANLQAMGWVEPATSRGSYRLGVDVMRLGGIAKDRLDVRESAMPALRRLRERTGATSFLCIRSDDRAVCVERIEGAHVRSLALTLGQSLPLHLGAAPRAILSFLPRAEREAVLSRLLDPSDTGTRGRAEQEIDATRDAGVAVSDGDVTPGIAALGAPIFDHRGEVRGALSVSGLRGTILGDEIDVAGLVRDAAEDVSRALGYARTEGAA